MTGNTVLRNFIGTNLGGIKSNPDGNPDNGDTGTSGSFTSFAID